MGGAELSTGPVRLVLNPVLLFEEYSTILISPLSSMNPYFPEKLLLDIKRCLSKGVNFHLLSKPQLVFFWIKIFFDLTFFSCDEQLKM